MMGEKHTKPITSKPKLICIIMYLYIISVDHNKQCLQSQKVSDSWSMWPFTQLKSKNHQLASSQVRRKFPPAPLNDFTELSNVCFSIGSPIVSRSNRSNTRRKKLLRMPWPWVVWSWKDADVRKMIWPCLWRRLHNCAGRPSWWGHPRPRWATLSANIFADQLHSTYGKIM